MVPLIHDLPEELLAIVFALAIRGNDAEYSQRRATLALVSRAWRAIVENTPRLWTRISDDYSPTLNTLSLSRSRNSPIDVTFNFPFLSRALLRLAKKSFRKACRQLHRWRSASISFGEDDLYRIITTPAPLLEEAHIELVLDTVELPCVDLFGGQAAHLRSISLDGLCIPWDSGMLSGLEVLKLDSILDYPPTIDDMMSFLQYSPLLSVLELSSMDFRALPSPTPKYPAIQLPRLRKLHINEVEYPIQYVLLGHIQAPSCQSASVHCMVDGMAEATLFVPLLRPFIPRNIAPRHGIADLEISSFDLNYALECPHHNPYSLNLGIAVDRHGPPISALLSPFFSALTPNLLDLDTHITLLEGVPPDDIREIFTIANKRRVTHLFVHTDEPAALDAVLRALTEPVEESSAGRWLFPALQELGIISDKVNSGLLSEMVKARYGIAPIADDLPLPLTELAVHEEFCEDADYAVVRDIVGTDVLMGLG